MENLDVNLTRWYNSIEGNDMAVFYFAGHGVEVAGENYLIPVGAELSSQTNVKRRTLNVNEVLGNMDEKRVKMKLLILDACRDNPFTRGWIRGNEGQGLASMSAPEGTFIAFAAAAGRTAQDGETYNLHNGVFTYYLKQEILKPGLSIDEIFNKVTGDVSNLTDRQQTPFKNSSLGDNFYFIPLENNPAPNPTPEPEPVKKIAETKKIPEETTLTVPADTLVFSSYGETKLIEVTTNAKDYNIYYLPKWIKAIKQPDGKLQISCNSNTSEKPQRDYLGIAAGEKTITVNVVQEGKEIPIPSPVETDSTTVINNSVPTPHVTEPNHNNSSSPISTSSNDYKKDVFGVDLGIGALKMYEWGTFIDLGIRWTHNFSPNIGLDIVNVKFQGYTKGSFGNDGVFHVMTGVRTLQKT